MLDNFIPKVIFEIGVGNPNICRTVGWMNKLDTRVVMFEPNPKTFKDLQAAFGAVPNVTIHNIALFDKASEIEFSLDGDSSYVSSVRSPTVNNAPVEYVASREKIKVQAWPLSAFDTGTIDLVLLDAEGSEFKIISTMVSRPKLVIVETHDQSKYFTPDIDKLQHWFANNGYRKVKEEVTDSWYMLA